MLSYDLLIRNGCVVDGTGNPWFIADLGIKKGKIVKIGKVAEKTAAKTIDATGLIVAPGFIDVHSHDDIAFFIDPLNKQKLQQGITTVVTGNCGISFAPVNRKYLSLLEGYTATLVGKSDITKWNSFAEYLDKLDHSEPGMNVASLVGHGTLRIAIMGMENREPTAEELEEMKKLLSQAMEEGAFGISTGLIYPPGVYSKTKEIVELCKVVAEYGGTYVSHIRGEGDTISQAIKEALEIGREANVPVEISHHKVSGKANWGRSVETLALIKEARADGIDVTADAYPYTAGSTMLTALFPPWVYAGGEQKFIERVKDQKTRAAIKRDIEEKTDWFNIIKGAESWKDILIVSSSHHPEYEGKSLLNISQGLNKDPYETLFDLAAEDGSKCMIVIFMMNDEDVERIICDPMVAIITDATFDTGVGKPHPRGFGTFPRVLGRYVREKSLMSLEEAIRKMTSLPAQRFNLKSKGLLREGFDADVTIFNPKNVIDKATYRNPRAKPDGIEYVIVNGSLVLRKNEFTKERPGKVIRRSKI